MLLLSLIKPGNISLLPLPLNRRGAHRSIDMGHVGENLYLACSATNLGTCGIGAYEQALCNELFGLDGKEEYIIYTETVGTIRAEDKDAEKDFYKFVEEAGW